jgi:hypothetical protein
MQGFGVDGADLAILIPTYNCAAFLGTTLASLRDQGVDAAQVLVVDDCSTLDDPEAVVEASGWPGIGFHRHPRNLGLLGNFRACVEMAERPWVHLLHGDDFVLPGAYEGLGRLLAAHPESRFLLGRSVFVGEDDQWEGITRRLGRDPSGPLPWDPHRWSLNPVQFAGVVFQRSAYDEVGGFDDRYVHCADWSLWWRLARAVPTAYTNTAVGAYRRFAMNHTSGTIRTAANITEALAVLGDIAAVEPSAGPALYGPLLDMTREQVRRFAAGDPAAFRSHLRAIAGFPRGVARGRAAARASLTHAKARGQRRVGVPEEL